MGSEKLLFFTAIALLVISSICFASMLEVRVIPVIKGVTFFTNNTFVSDTNAIKSEVFWENMGSIGCIHRYRLDYYYGMMNKTKKIEINNRTYIDPLDERNQMRLIHSSFSQEPLAPGGKRSIYSYFIPLINSSDDYIEMSVQPRVYLCGEVIYLNPYELNLSLVNVSFNNDIGLEILDAGNDEYSIEYELKSSENAEILIIPYRKPFWYDIPSTAFELKKNKVSTTSIPFVADDIKTNQRNISFVFASPDLKKIYAMHTMEMKFPEEEKMSFFAVVIIALMFLAARKRLMGMFARKKAKSKLKHESKKKKAGKKRKKK